MKDTKQKVIAEKIIKNYLSNHRFIEEKPKEILVSSIGYSENYKSFLKEIIFGFKMKGLRVLYVSVDIIESNQLCLKINNENLVLNVKYQDTYFFDLEKVNDLFQLLSKEVKEMYDLILYSFENINPFLFCPDIFKFTRNLVVFINKKNTNIEDLADIAEVLENKRTIQASIVISKK